MPILGCNPEAAVAIIIGNHEQLFATSLDQHLRQCVIVCNIRCICARTYCVVAYFSVGEGELLHYFSEYAGV